VVKNLLLNMRQGRRAVLIARDVKNHIFYGVLPFVPAAVRDKEGKSLVRYCA
jgi:hypothetical protein